MKILVTGASGFIGQHVVPVLLEQGHQVAVLARRPDSFASFTWESRVKVEICDLFSPKPEIDKVLHGVDGLFHFAWSGLPNYLSLHHIELDLNASYAFVKRAIEAGIKRIVVTGTCFEYGMQDGCLREESPVAPTNSYAIAKNSLRQFLEVLASQNGAIVTWARLFYSYGKGQNPGSLFGQLQAAIDRGDRKFNMSPGDQLRDYLPIEEVGRILANLFAKSSKSTVVNVCSGKPISVRSFVENFIERQGANIELNLGHYPYSKLEPLAFWGSTDRLESILRFEDW